MDGRTQEPTAAMAPLPPDAGGGLTPRQKRVLGVLAALVAALSVLLLVLALVKDDGGDRVATSVPSTTSSTEGSTTTTSATSTTTAVAIPPAMPPTTTPTSTTTTAASPSTTSPPRPVVTGQGAVLSPPAAPSTRTLSPDGGCESLADPGSWEVRCDTVRVRGGQLIWLVAERPTANGTRTRRAYVFQRSGPGSQWNLVLEERDDEGTRLAGVNVRAADLSADGSPELAFGFATQGSASVLSVDVVDASATVVAHRDLPKGVVRVSTGQVDTWSAEGGAGEANCCPSSFVHEVIRFVDGAYRVLASERVRPEDVPPSQL